MSFEKCGVWKRKQTKRPGLSFFFFFFTALKMKNIQKEKNLFQQLSTFPSQLEDGMWRGDKSHTIHDLFALTSLKHNKISHKEPEAEKETFLDTSSYRCAVNKQTQTNLCVHALCNCPSKRVASESRMWIQTAVMDRQDVLVWIPRCSLCAVTVCQSPPDGSARPNWRSRAGNHDGRRKLLQDTDGLLGR